MCSVSDMYLVHCVPTMALMLVQILHDDNINIFLSFAMLFKF